MITASWDVKRQTWRLEGVLSDLTWLDCEEVLLCLSLSGVVLQLLMWV